MVLTLEPSVETTPGLIMVSEEKFLLPNTNPNS